MTPFPKDDDRDFNPEIDQIIEDKLFDNRYVFGIPVDDEMYQYNFEMRPYIYPDVE
jgi:hypothetical protein